jgi:carbon-monoxide dehydrogenase medium subunit
LKAPDFSYFRPETLQQALDALSHHGDGAVVLAGGQSLMAMLNLRVAAADVLVDINRIPGLDTIRGDGDDITIGALTRYAQLQASPLVTEHLPLLSEALPHVAHEAVRNRGTLGGSLALADPAAEIPACCLALDARVVVAGPRGKREVRMEDWFRGVYETALEAGELIVEVRVPKRTTNSVVRFTELARRRGDFAVAGVALIASLHEGVLRNVRIALLGVADRPVLAYRVMTALEGASLEAIDADAAAKAVEVDIDPLDDPAYPAAYRRQAINVLLQRALKSLEVKR